MTDLDLAPIRERRTKISPAPWEYNRYCTVWAEPLDAADEAMAERAPRGGMSGTVTS